MPKEYTTIQGDMWDGIAKKTTGSEYNMSALIEANPEHIKTVIFPANVVLVIPDIVEQEPQNMPPWKLGEI